jgi:hypothetical protein
LHSWAFKEYSGFSKRIVTPFFLINQRYTTILLVLLILTPET